MLRAVSRLQLGKHVGRSGLVRVPVRTNITVSRVSRQQLINPQIRNRSLGPAAKTPKATGKSFTTQREWSLVTGKSGSRAKVPANLPPANVPPKKPRRPGVCVRLLKWIFIRNGFSKAFSFLAGILLRAPGVAVLRFIALRFASGPPVLKAVGAFILGILGITAAGEERLPAPPPAPTLPAGVQVQKERDIPIPRDWQIQSAGDVRMRRVELSHFPLRPHTDRNGEVQVGGYIDKYLERVMHDTSHNKCIGSDGTGLTKRARVLKVERIENMRLWKTYWHRKREMLDSHRANRVRVSQVEPMPSAPMLGPKSALDQEQLLEAGLNETFLFHGTSVEVAGIIAEHGFDERVASMEGLYGAGIYHASQACKAAQYAKKAPDGTKTVIVSRVLLGDPFMSTTRLKHAMKSARRPPERRIDAVTHETQKGVTYDSCVAVQTSGQVHQEFIVYDKTQAYPEYVITFKPAS